MTKDQEKILTEKLLKRCWHEVKRPKSEPTVFHKRCVKCKKTIYIIRGKPIDRDRTFLTWQDLGDCKEAFVREGLWEDFVDFAWADPSDRFNEKYPHGLYDAMFMAWLFRPTDEKGEAHFCRLVAVFLDGKP